MKKFNRTILVFFLTIAMLIPSLMLLRPTDVHAAGSVSYNTHVQTYGWRGWSSNGATSGTTGLGKRMEAIQIKVGGVSGGIQYRTHIQGIGWQGWKANGAMSGTSGQSRRLEAIQIQLTGAIAKQYDVYYRVHAQTFGWLAWTRNGQKSGTEGMSKRLEAIQIKLVKKGTSVSGYNPSGACKAAINGNNVTWIGDSYSAINRNVIYSKLPGVDLQAQSGKFISRWGGGEPGISIAQRMKNAGTLRKTVVFALGTNSNDGVTQAELNQLRNIFGNNYKVVFVTARTNRATYAAGNARLRNFCNQYSNYYLYDWANSGYKPGYILYDGVHPNATGINVWVDGIKNVLNSTV